MYQRILVPIDGSTTSTHALDTAIGLVKAFAARLRLVHLVEEMAYFSGHDQYGGYSAEFLQAIREEGVKVLQRGLSRAIDAGVDADHVLIESFGERVGETVATAAKLWNADLIVVGTHGRRGFNRLLLGSGAEQIIRIAPAPVLVVRSPDEADSQPGGTV